MSVVSIKEQQEQIKDWNQFSERKQDGYDAYREQIEDWNAYDKKQQQELKRAIDSGVPFDLMCSPLFSATAMRVLRLGMARGYDMEAYADPDWSDHELWQLIKGIETNCDPDVFMRPDLNWRQMQEVRLGIEHSIDVTPYLDSSFDALQMWQIRNGLEHQIDMTPYLPKDEPYDFFLGEAIRFALENGAGPEEIEEVKVGYKENIDIAAYADKRLNHEQMREVRIGLEYGLNVELYNNSALQPMQMHEVLLGLSHQLSEEDVRVFSNPGFDAKQMRQIREGAEAGIDFKAYAKPEYDDMQMMVLKESLEAGVDISSFNHPSINWVDMMDESLRQSDNYDARLSTRASFALPEEQKARRQGSINQDNQRATEIRDKPIKTVKGAELSAVAKNTEKMYWDRMEEFDARQLLQIGAAERQDFTDEEIQMFADPQFSWQQMQELRLGIEAGIDITLLADKRFDSFQMQEIRLGLEDGMNVSTFAKPEINDVNMWLARHDLENTDLGKNVENAVCKEEAQENPNVKDAEWSAER